MEEENTPSWLSGTAKDQYEKFMREVLAKHEEFVQRMQASHEEFMQKMMQHTQNNISTSTMVMDANKRVVNTIHDANASKGNVMGPENPNNFQEEENDEGPSSGLLRSTSLLGAQTGSSSSTCASISVTSSPSVGASFLPVTGSTPMPINSFGQTPFGRPRGSCRLLASYRSTNETDNSLAGQVPGKLISISAMPQYIYESHEELRWKDYQLGNKGCNISFQSAQSFGQPTPPLGKSTLGPKSSFGGFGSPGPTQLSPSRSTEVAFGTQPLGAAIPPAFGAASTSAFGSTSTPAFGSTLTPTFAFRTQPFGSAILPAFGAASTSAFGSTSTPAFGTTTSFDVTNVPAFGAPSTSAGKASSIPSFEFFIPPAFGATSATTFADSSSRTSCQTEPTSRTQPFGVAAQPAFSFSATSIPAFGSTSTIGTTTISFGATNVLAFGAPNTSGSEASSIPSFHFFSTPAFGATSATTFASNPSRSTSCQTGPSFWTQPFGASVQPTFSATGMPAFGCPYMPGTNTSTTSFGAKNVLVFGAPNTSASQASSIHSFGLCGPQDTVFGPTSAPTFGFNASPFGSQSSASGPPTFVQNQQPIRNNMFSGFGQIPTTFDTISAATPFSSSSSNVFGSSTPIGNAMTFNGPVFFMCWPVRI